MHFQKLAIVFALSAIGLAQDVDSNDIPPACQSVCGNIVSLTQNCDNTTSTTHPLSSLKGGMLMKLNQMTTLLNSIASAPAPTPAP